jgi:hypothetical protein
MPRVKRQSPKAANVSAALNRSLTVYALAAGAAGVSLLALAPRAAAQIAYTPAHDILNRDGLYTIDLNHDGIADLLIRQQPYFHEGQVLSVVPPNGNAVVEGALGWAAAMSAGSVVGSSKNFFPHKASMAILSRFGYYYASWAPNTIDHYLGLKFLISGETHYGWARMTVQIHLQTRQIYSKLTGYAYQIQPNTPIAAGDMGSGTAGNETFSSVEAESEAERQVQLSRPHKATLGLLARGWKPDV